MGRVILKGLVAHRLRFVLTALSVALGVAFMAGTLMVTDTVGANVNALFSNASSGVDAYVTGQPVYDGGSDGPVPRGVLKQVRRVEGVRAAEGDATGQAQILDAGGKPIANPGLPQVGGAWLTDEELNPYTLVAGAPPADPGDVVIDRGSARKLGLSVGDRVEIEAAGRIETYQVAGVVTFGDVDSALGGTVALFTPKLARRLFGLSGAFAAVSVAAQDGVSQEELVQRITAAVPAEAKVITGSAYIERSQQGVNDTLRVINTVLLIFASIALLVGAFIIYNTFSIVIVQRTREMALLRALGAARRGVLWAVLVEATVVGLLASVAGIAGGVGFALGLPAVLRLLQIDLPSGGVILSPRTIMVAAVTGVAMTVMSAVLPAMRASRIPPLAALRDMALDRSGRSVARMVLGLLVSAAAAALLALGLLSDMENPLPLLGAGGALGFVGVTILGPLIARPFSRALGSPLPTLRGMPGTLAKNNAARNPRRTAATASALTIGVGLVSFITIFGASTRATAEAEMEGVSDFEVSHAQFEPLPDSLPELIRDVPGVAAASGVRNETAQLDGEPLPIVAVDTTQIEQLMRLEVQEGSLVDLSADGIALSADAAQQGGWSLGDTVPLTFYEVGEAPLRVEAIFAAGGTAVGPHIVSERTAATLFMSGGERSMYEVYVAADDGADKAQVRAALEDAVAEEVPNAAVEDAELTRHAMAGLIDRILNFLYALLGLAVLIALIGITNTLALSVFERTRELGLLRAVGMTRTQVRVAVRWESVIIALLGTVLGLAMGLGFSWVLVTALADTGFAGLVIPGQQLAIQVVVAAIAGVIAAIGPAQRAAKLDVLRAIATE
jgi:putative ABC transport system permease protein